MTSPYFMENRSVMTRSASQTAGRTPAASLRTKLTNRRRNEDPVCAVPVKVEVEEKSVSELELRLLLYQPVTLTTQTDHVRWYTWIQIN